MAEVEEKNWFQKNWKWLVPVGCLIPICCILAIGGIAMTALGVIRSTDVYTEALTTAQSDPRALDALGDPIEDGWFMTGNVDTNSSNGAQSGTADLSIPISGPNGSGTLEVDAVLNNGRWDYSQMEIILDDGSGTINLLGR